MNWTLLVFLLVGGGFSSTTTNLMTLTNIPGFRSEELCLEAGQKVTETLNIDTRRSGQYRHVCLRQQ